MIELSSLLTTQKSIDLNKVKDLQEHIPYLDPVLLCISSDKVAIINGHHRCAAYYLSGRTHILYQEFILISKEYHKNIFFSLKNLIEYEQRRQEKRN